MASKLWCWPHTHTAQLQAAGLPQKPEVRQPISQLSWLSRHSPDQGFKESRAEPMCAGFRAELGREDCTCPSVSDLCNRPSDHDPLSPKLATPWCTCPHASTCLLQKGLHSCDAIRFFLSLTFGLTARLVPASMDKHSTTSAISSFFRCESCSFSCFRSWEHPKDEIVQHPWPKLASNSFARRSAWRCV